MSSVKMGFIELPVRSRHGVDIAKLPDIHGDPFDRMLIAQAKAENMSFLTHDSLMPYYKEKCIISV